MRTTGKIFGYALCWLGYLYCLVMLWVNVIQWWSWSVIWVFILSPVLAFFIPIIAWIVEGTFPVWLFAGWGVIILGAIILGVAGND
jgi:hypothetical protein